jgi:hypothetical protein
MKKVSVGFVRDDGDFQLLATFNNLDNSVSDEVFDGLVDACVSVLTYWSEENIVALERDDAPDYVELDSEVNNEL